MYLESRLLEKSPPLMHDSALRFVDIPEESEEPMKYALGGLNLVLEKVFRTIHKKDLDLGFNRNVIDRFMNRTIGFKDTFDSIDALSVLQNLEKPSAIAMEETEPVR